MTHRSLLALAAASVLLSTAVAPSSAGPDGNAASSLRRRPFTVVAVIDTGINPYHADFGAPEMTVHPSRFIDGFPEDVPPLDLSLEATSLGSGLKADAKKWRAIREGEPVWIPGTNIISAMNIGGARKRFFDTTDHGTATASLTGGRIHGPATDDVLIVVVNDFVYGLQWASRQPWIDVITNSWGPLLPYPTYQEVAVASRRATRNGKIVCFSSANSASPNVPFSGAGPSWTVNVGAASEQTRGDHSYSNYPNDVVGLSHVRAATNDSLQGERYYAGTSFSAPAVCGQAARAISEARRLAGDFEEGPASGSLVQGRSTHRGPMSDGKLTRREVERALELTATPAEPSPPDPLNDPWAIPALPLVPFLRDGYGIVDHASGSHAVEVLLGKQKAPERPLEDRWAEIVNQIRDTIWN